MKTAFVQALALITSGDRQLGIILVTTKSDRSHVVL